jgi:hypothetical protein
MPWQAQPLVAWPKLYLWGVLLGTLRVRGVRLRWLIATYAVYDTLILLGLTLHS